MTSDERAAMSPGAGRSHERATIRDVARVAGVSVTTVSRALGGSADRVKPDTLAKITRAVDQLDFVVNAHARALAGRGSRSVAFLVADMVGPSFALLASGVEAVATELGYLFMLFTTHGDVDRESELMDSMREQRSAAVLLVGAVVPSPEYERRIAAYARELASVGSKLVLCGRPPISTRPDVMSVEYDNFGGGYAVTQHLLELGHRSMLFVGAIEGHSSSMPRFAGHRAALADAGITNGELLDPVPDTFDVDSAHAAVGAALDAGARPTAIVAVTDYVAVGALRALRERGIRVPDDMSLTGFDDLPLITDLTPSLTTVTVPFAELGRATTELALNGTGSPAYKHVVLPVALTIRESTAAPQAAVKR